MSFEKDDKALTISSAEHKEPVKPRTPTSAGSSNILIVVDTEQSDGCIQRTDSDNSLRGQRKKSLRDDVDYGLGPSSNGVSGRPLPLEPSRSTSTLVTGGSCSSGSSATSTGSTGNLLVTAPRQIRANNLNIRAPQGIPVTARKPFINPSTAPSADEEVDTNPLRRLRDSQSGFGRPMMTFRPLGGSSKQPVLPTTTTSNILPQDESNQRSLNVNLSFFDKLKEQEEQKLS